MYNYTSTIQTVVEVHYTETNLSSSGTIPSEHPVSKKYANKYQLHTNQVPITYPSSTN